jgi:hypothetical protein
VYTYICQEVTTTKEKIMNNKFLWDEIHENLIRQYGLERGLRIGERASRTHSQTAKGIAKAVANAIEWERRERAVY